MNNTTFSFNKKQIIQSVLEPDTHSIWLNSNDNKLYKFGSSGWEPVGNTNIYRIYLTPLENTQRLILDPKYDKENTLARKAYGKDNRKYTNNIYLITLNRGLYEELTGIANCYENGRLLTEIMIGIDQDPKTLEYSLSKMIISTDSEIFGYIQHIPNDEVYFIVSNFKIQATPIK